MKTLLFTLLFLIGGAAYAQEVSLPQFLLELMAAIKSMGGLSTMAVISVVLTLLISSTKVSALAKYTWEKLNASVKPFVAPGLALLLGLVQLWLADKAPSLADVAAYLFAGVGSSYLHSILDGLKALPGIGKGLQIFIDLMEAALGGKK